MLFQRETLTFNITENINTTQLLIDLSSTTEELQGTVVYTIARSVPEGESASYFQTRYVFFLIFQQQHVEANVLAYFVFVWIYALPMYTV